MIGGAFEHELELAADGDELPAFPGPAEGVGRCEDMQAAGKLLTSERLPRGAYLVAATMARASSASITMGTTMPIAPQSRTILIHSCLPAGTRASGTQPASAMAPNISAAV